MLGLSFVGPLVENAIGKFWYVVGYLISGTGGMLIAINLYTYDRVDTPIVLVGASANVLGLVGIAAASALRKYRVSRSAMAQIVLLQVIFDSLVPQVSSRAHIAGAAVGFLFGLIISYLPSPPNTRRGPVW
jgi:membrane associated rhomboid family serine protease